MPTHTESERTFQINDDFTLPDVGLRTAPAPTRVLTARYFDTSDLRLIRRGITLRRREGGDDDGWHLKLPKGPDTKEEIREPLSSAPSDQIPTALTDLVAGLVRGRSLHPVAVITTTRSEQALRDTGGVILAELADDRVHAERLARGGAEPPEVQSWREVEVELVNGRADVLDRIGRKLTKAGARPAENPSKLARTLGDALPAPATLPDASTTAGVLAAGLSRRVEQILRYDPLVRIADHDDDSVHKMRVGVRRVRSLLRTHRPVLDRTRIAPLESELKWLSDLLGEVRDLEVLCARFNRELAELPAGVIAGSRGPGWLIDLAREEDQARARLREALGSPRYLALIEALENLPLDLPTTRKAADPARKRTRKLVRRALRKTRTAWKRARSLPPGDDRDAALHRTRKAAKRLRYTAETAKPAVPKARKVARHAERLQDVLGEYHDSVVATGLLTATARSAATNTPEAFDLGLLTAAEQHRRAKATGRTATVAKKATKHR